MRVTAAKTRTMPFKLRRELSSVAGLESKVHWYDTLQKKPCMFWAHYGCDPKVYYYRKFIEGRTPDPWEKVKPWILTAIYHTRIYNNHVYLVCFGQLITHQTDLHQTPVQVQLAHSDIHGKCRQKNFQKKRRYQSNYFC